MISLIPVLLALWLLLSLLKPETDASKASVIKRFWILKTHSEKKYSLLLCGDSRTYRGMSPQAMKKVLPDFSIYNFGYSSGSFSPFMLDQIEKRLDFDAPTKVLYLGITPYSLTPKAAKDGHISQELARKKEEIWESLYLEPLEQFFEPYQLNWDKPGDSVLYIQEYKTTGWVATTKIPPSPEEAIPIYTKDFQDNSVSNTVIDSLVARVKRWTERRVIVFAARPPTTNAMINLENTISGFNENEFVLKFEEAGGIWLQTDIDDYQSFDGSHLDIPSAIKFSTDIASMIKTELSRRAN